MTGSPPPRRRLIVCTCVSSPVQSTTAPAQHSCTGGPEGLNRQGVNTNSVGTIAFQIRGNAAGGGRGRTFLLRDTVVLEEIVFVEV